MYQRFPLKKERGNLVGHYMCMYVVSHLSDTIRTAGLAAELLVKAKNNKYSALEPIYYFVPFAVGAAGTWVAEAKEFIRKLDRRLGSPGAVIHALHLTWCSKFYWPFNAVTSHNNMGTFGPATIQSGPF